MIIIMAILAMLYIIPIVAFIILMMWLLHRMNRPGKSRMGWMTVFGVFLIVTALCFVNAKYGVRSGDGWQSYQLWPENKEIQYAGIDVAYDEDTREILGFGNLVLQYEKGNRYIPLEFDETGKLIGPSAALRYKKEISDVLSNGGPRITLTGKSSSYEVMRKLEHERMNQHKNVFHKDFFLYDMLYFQWITLVLLIYNLADIMRKKKKEARNTERIKIQDL